MLVRSVIGSAGNDRAAIVAEIKLFLDDNDGQWGPVTDHGAVITLC